jgi:hypothetical protein
LAALASLCSSPFGAANVWPSFNSIASHPCKRCSRQTGALVGTGTPPWLSASSIPIPCPRRVRNHDCCSCDFALSARWRPVPELHHPCSDSTARGMIRQWQFQVEKFILSAELSI